MSFFSGNRQGCNPGPIVGNPLQGLCEKACIQTTKVFDACMKQLQLDDTTLTLTDLTPADPTVPLTFVGCSADTAGVTISGVVITMLLIFISLLVVFTNSINIDLPIINIAFKCGNIWGYCSIIVVWISLFTTLILNTYALLNQTFFMKNKLLKFVLIMLIASLISLIKFSIIVQWVYLIISTFSIVYFCCIYYVTKHSKSNKILHTKNAVSLHL